MNWDMVERNWTPFKSKVTQLLSKLSDENLDALFARRVDRNTKGRIGQQVKHYGQQNKG